MSNTEEINNDEPTISELSLELNSDDTYTNKKYSFVSNKESFSIFKPEDELYINVFLKALSYNLYKPFYETLQIDPPLYRKYKADLAAFNYSGEPICWVECLERDYEKIEYICKHMNIEEMILVEVSDNINLYLEKIRKKVHYKYHDLISVVNFVPEISYYIDPQEIVLIRDWYEVFHL
ncbi:MAG: hypothetical protein U0457_07025 [Candidatus Sericytochromatia bacterium]